MAANDGIDSSSSLLLPLRMSVALLLGVSLLLGETLPACGQTVTHPAVQRHKPQVCKTGTAASTGADSGTGNSKHRLPAPKQFTATRTAQEGLDPRSYRRDMTFHKESAGMISRVAPEALWASIWFTGGISL